MKNSDHIEESRILNIPIANLNYNQVVKQIITWAQSGESKYVGVCNVHSTTSATWTPSLRSALQNADLNTADGVPLVWMQKILGYPNATRVYGPTLMLHTLKAANELALKMAFYGGHPDRLQILLKRIRKDYPKLQIVEAISPPFRQLSDEEDTELTQQLRDSNPDILWVGLGCPKQEQWMQEHRSKIPAVMVGVGAAFDFHAGAVKQAPHFIQKLGLEWAYRLYMEPKRLFKRYITTNPTFVAKAIVQIANQFLTKRQFIQRRSLRTNQITTI